MVGLCPDLIRVIGLSSNMANLRYLRIYWCDSLRQCVGLDELYALEALEFSTCGKLKELPCLGRLTKLKTLLLFDCKSIRAVPGLGDLVALEEFDASDLKLGVLPNLAKLTKLQKLQIKWCPVQEMPGLDGLIALTRLEASFDKLSGEPPVLSKLSALKVVGIGGWNGPIWTSIQNLVMLEELELWDCQGEDVVPDLNIVLAKFCCSAVAIAFLGCIISNCNNPLTPSSVSQKL